jgi:hypothetical protein
MHLYRIYAWYEPGPMYLLQSIYPVAVASVNMALGWLLYDLFGFVFGSVLVAIGVFVILALVGGSITERRPVRSESA